MIAYVLDPTPARHCQGGEGPLPPGLLPEYDRMSFKGRGLPHKLGKCCLHVFNAAGLCMFVVGDGYGQAQCEFKVPDRIMGRPPKDKGPRAGVTLIEDEVYNEYLTAMDWDLKTTKPSKQKLLELGLPDVAAALYK